jgi:hypothetical protein
MIQRNAMLSASVAHSSKKNSKHRRQVEIHSSVGLVVEG